jgi:disulfide bond formation protein DsbB
MHAVPLPAVSLRKPYISLYCFHPHFRPFQAIAWAILLGSTLFLELCGMFFQHVMGLQPCVMCIYQRVAILGIMAGAAIGFINPKNFFLRWSGLLVWAYSSVQGLQLALRHTDIQLHPSPFNTCDLFVTFPRQELPLNFRTLAGCIKKPRCPLMQRQPLKKNLEFKARFNLKVPI